MSALWHGSWLIESDNLTSTVKGLKNEIIRTEFNIILAPDNLAISGLLAVVER
jgi:hypothetical protein